MTKIIHQSHFVIIAQNKRARYEYFIEEEFEAGLILQGWEEKSLRAGKANISNSYVTFKNKEAYILGAIFQPLTSTSSHIICDPMRTRKLIMHQHELNKLFNQVNRKSYTIVSLSLYWKHMWIKIKIGLAKGKKNYDKRANSKEREWKIKQTRILKQFKTYPCFHRMNVIYYVNWG